jgi:hypothetical protein
MRLAALMCTPQIPKLIKKHGVVLEINGFYFPFRRSVYELCTKKAKKLHNPQDSRIVFVLVLSISSRVNSGRAYVSSPTLCILSTLLRITGWFRHACFLWDKDNAVEIQENLFLHSLPAQTFPPC